MWTITGPFDYDLSDYAEEDQPMKEKLLKCGKEYTIGRKDCDIVIRSKRVSKVAAKVTVGGWTANDVTNPDAVPVLRITNHKNKDILVSRGGKEGSEPLNSGMTMDLEDGCNILLITKMTLKLRWRKVVCYEMQSKARELLPVDGCASLGINVVHSPSPAVTHHLLPSYNLTPPIAASLISNATLVKSDWLRDTIRLGMLGPDDQLSLENNFVLPSATAFRPGFSPTLRDTLAEIRTWEPNEERAGMFSTIRFVFVGETGREVTADYRDLVTRGGGEYDVFSVSSGSLSWQKLLAKCAAWKKRRNGSITLVADGESMEAAVGIECWSEIVNVAEEQGLRFVVHENILQAVAYVDTFYIDCSGGGHDAMNSGLPDFIANTHPDEPSVPAEDFPPADPMYRPPPRRGASIRLSDSSKSSSAATRNSSRGEESEIGRRPPPRRVHRSTYVSSNIGESPVPLPEAAGVMAALESSNADITGMPLMRPMSRRAQTGSSKNTAKPSDVLAASTSTTTNQLSRYKALYEEASQSISPERNAESPSTVGFGMAGSLSVIQEDGEGLESQNRAQTDRQLKRTAADAELSDPELKEIMDERNLEDNATPAQSNLRKRRAIDINIAQQGPDHQSGVSPQSLNEGSLEHHGSDPVKTGHAGCPDSDERFLKALNSMKRGKKKEDDFDRDFNKLRISRPNTTHNARHDEWDVLAEFGDESIRGNFMVIVDMDVDSPPRKSARGTTSNSAATWPGRDNFKAFKKSKLSSSRKPIEVVLNDGGLNSAEGLDHWQDLHPGTRSRMKRTELASAQYGLRAVANITSGHRHSRALSKKHGATETPLFLDSDDNTGATNGQDTVRNQVLVQDEGSENSDHSSSTKSHGGQKRKNIEARLDYDSDDGAFKGFGRSKKKGRLI